MMMMRYRMMMRSSSSSFVVVALHLLLFTTTISITTTNAQQVFVSDLELTTDVGKFSSPTDLTFLSDGTLLVTSKSGLLQQSQPPYNGEKKIILDISSVVCTNGERGLSSVEVHPDFDNNGYLYLFYPYAKYGNCNEDANDGPVNRLSRFTYHRNDGDSVIDASTEVVFFETPSLLTDHHNGGDIAFGPSDGYLYVTLGDAGDQSTPQDNSNLFGSILRLTDDNEIPADNPFVNHNKHQAVRCHEHGQSYHPDQPCLEIFAWGLRNPFKFSMNPSATKKTEFYVNDVGAASWEEVSVGGTDYVGANYGWPAREGYCKQGHNCGETCGKDESSSSSFYYEPPLHAYNHFGDDAAVTAGTFVTTDSSWSDDYNGKYLYADFVSSTVFRLDYTGKGDVTSCPVVSNYTAVPLMEYAKSDIAVMKFFANTLYLLSRGFGGRLHTLSYVGAGTNRAPQAKITTNATTVVAVGDVLRLSAVESIDPDEGDTTKLKYEWDFNNDGVVDSREMEPVVSFDEVGVHVVSLKVRDGKGGRTTDTIEIGVGTPPTATMLIPQEGHLFQVGESFVLTAESTDDDDATFSWEVRQHHSTHYHPYLEPTEGNFVPLQASPAPEDFLATTNSYLEVRLTVTNRRTGLFSVLSRNVMPQLITVHIDSSPVSNQTVVVDDYEVTTPVTFVTWASHSLSLQATDFGYDDNNNYQFQSWSHGAAQKHLMRMPNNPNVEPRFVVNYVRTNTMSPTTTTTMAPTTKSPTAKPTTIGTLFSPSFNATTILESAMSHNPTTTVVSSPTFRPTTRTTPPPTTLEPTTTMSPSTRNPIFIFPPRPFQSNNDNNGQPSTNNNTMAIIFSSLGACFLTMITCVGCLLVLQHKKKKRRRRGNKNKNVVLLPLYNDNDAVSKSKKMQQQQHDSTDILPILEVSFEECSNATRSISPMNDDDDEEEDVKNESFFPTTTNDTNNNDNNNHDKVPPTTTTTAELLVVEETTTDTPSSSTCSTTSTPASSDTTTNSRAASLSQSSPTLLIPQDGGGTTEIFLEEEEEGPNAYNNSTFDATTETEEGETKMHDSSLSLSKEFDEEALLEWAQRQLLLTAESTAAPPQEKHDGTTTKTTIPTSPTKVRTLASSSMISCPSDERKKKTTTTTAAPQDEPPATKTTTIPTSPTKVRTLASSSMMEQKQQQENNTATTTTTTPTRRIIITSQQAATTTIMTPAEISYKGVVMDTDTTTTPKPADLSHKGAVLDELSSSDHSSSCRRNSKNNNNNSTTTTNNNTTPAQEFKILSSSLEEEIPTTTDDDNDDSNNATTTTKLSPLEWAQQQQVVLQDADDDAMEMTSDLPNEATTTPAKEEFKPLYEHYFNT